MNSSHRKNLLALALLLASSLTTASGQVVSPSPVIGIQPIDLVLVGGQPIELYFPNLPDRDHPKKLTWQGTVDGDPAAGGVTMWFDWVDDAGVPAVSGNYHLPVGTPENISLIIPFCPPQVSIHFETVNPGPPPVTFRVVGTFTHECLIPEPADYAVLAALGMLGFGIVRRVRRG